MKLNVTGNNIHILVYRLYWAALVEIYLDRNKFVTQNKGLFGGGNGMRRLS